MVARLRRHEETRGRAHQSRCGGQLPDVDKPIHPRVSLQFPIPVAEVWEGQSRTISSRFRADRDRTQFEWSRVNLALNYPVLARLQEHMPGTVLVEIVNSNDGTVLATYTKDLAILAANSWHFEAEYCDALSAFVPPSDPYIAEILRKAQDVLVTWHSSTISIDATRIPGNLGSSALESHSVVISSVTTGIERSFTNHPCSRGTRTSRIRQTLVYSASDPDKPARIAI
jgi:hypothetical protein